MATLPPTHPVTRSRVDTTATEQAPPVAASSSQPARTRLSQPAIPTRTSSLNFGSAPRGSGPRPAATSRAVPKDWPLEIRHVVYQHLEPNLRTLHGLRRADKSIGGELVSRYPIRDLAQALRLVDRTLDLTPGAVRMLPTLKAYFTPEQAAGLVPIPNARAQDLRAELDQVPEQSLHRFANLTEDAMAGLEPAEVLRLAEMVPWLADTGDDDLAEHVLTVANFLGEKTGKAFEPYAAHFKTDGDRFLRSLERAHRSIRDAGQPLDNEDHKTWYALAPRAPGRSLDSLVGSLMSGSWTDRSVALAGLALGIGAMDPKRLEPEKEQAALDEVLRHWAFLQSGPPNQPDFVAVLAQLRPAQLEPVVDRLFDKTPEDAMNDEQHQRGEVLAVSHRLTPAQFDKLAAMLAPVEHRMPPFHHAKSLLRLPETLAQMDAPLMHERREPIFRMVDTLRDVAWDLGDVDFVRSHAESVAQLIRAHVTRPDKTPR